MLLDEDYHLAEKHDFGQADILRTGAGWTGGASSRSGPIPIITLPGKPSAHASAWMVLNVLAASGHSTAWGWDRIATGFAPRIIRWNVWDLYFRLGGPKFSFKRHAQEATTRQEII